MYSRILVPIALEHLDHSNASIKVARHLLAEGGEITLLNVIEDIPTFAQNYIPEGTLEANQNHAVKAMDALAQEVGQGFHAAVVHGKPNLAILDHAEKINADCIVIASHKPGLEDYLIGSTAGRVVRHAKCCVHVIR